MRIEVFKWQCVKQKERRREKAGGPLNTQTNSWLIVGRKRMKSLYPDHASSEIQVLPRIKIMTELARVIFQSDADLNHVSLKVAQSFGPSSREKPTT